MHRNQFVEQATRHLEYILEWPDDALAQLDAAGQQAMVAMLDLLNKLPTLLAPSPDEQAGPDEDVLDRVIVQLKEHIQALDGLLPAEPDFFAGQGHLGVSLDDVEDADQPDQPLDPMLYEYVHNTLLECRDKLWNALHDPSNQMRTDLQSGQQEPREGNR